MNLVSGLVNAGVALVSKIPQILSDIKNNFMPLVEIFTGLWENVKKVFSGVSSFFGKVFKEGFNAVKNAFSNFKSFFSDLWDSIKNTFSSLGTSIGNAISGAVKAGINGVIGMIENTINTAIRLINGALNVINKIPGVSVRNINTLQLRRLAKGGIINKPTIAEIGEAGREAVIPLENNKGWIKELAADLRAALINPINDTKANNLYNISYSEMVNAFKDALGQMKVELDDEAVGSFVEKTITDAIYI
jgi:phage-related protein